MVMRGEIWLVRLDPTEGHEIQKTRPCVIISPPELHNYLRIVMVAPMTTGSYFAPYRIPITFGKRTGLVLLDQIRTIDKKRLIKKLGKTSDKTLGKILDTLQKIFSLN
ncbi:MAG: type II toxin-antitoxin system PemK/MazF family toxin [Gammaproteobacteria bacterium]|nr:type II toxin-antitoxin system PemK/MazF family toxin [Gammaproteobacteria bacterium]